MTFLVSILSLLFFSTDVVNSDITSEHLGKWQYEVVTPDITYKGILELSQPDGEYAGAIKSEGVEIPLADINIDGNDITWTMNVQGFPCTVTGTFEGNTFKGNVSVEGLTMPMTASRM